METNAILQTVEQYGLPLVLLLGSIFALYKFLVFSLVSVRAEFSRRHEDNAKAVGELKVSVAEMRSDIKILVEFVRSNR